MTNPTGFQTRTSKSRRSSGGLQEPRRARRRAEHAADTGPRTSTVEDRDRRMQWWHEARFGMFIHWGLYSVIGRHEWAMEEEGIPVAEYQQLAKQFKPKPNAARDWANWQRPPAEVHGDDHQAP